MKIIPLFYSVFVLFSAHAQILNFDTFFQMDGSQVVPASASPATGQALKIDGVTPGLTFDVDSGILSVDVVIFNLMGTLIDFGFYDGAPDENGTLVHSFPFERIFGSTWRAHGTFDASANKASILADDTYLQGVTSAGTELRGNLTATAIPEPHEYAIMTTLALIGFGLFHRTRK